ncbi:hypothetical protein QQF64_029312, partial [Cirrhinus molitorella]
AFDVVEKSYFETIDDALAEKASLQSQLPEGVYLSAQKIAERLKALEQEVSGGATAIVALILNNKLYIANVGTNRALLCKTTTDGQNQVIQIGRAHTTDNDDELSRLAQLGLDPVRLKQTGLISGQSSTRRIGDYKVKFSYTDIDVLSAAKQEPIISEPEIHGGQSLEGVTGFLLLMSEGLIKALESAHGPEQVNQEVVAMVAAELAQQSTLEAAAQSVVERVKRLHHDAYVSGRQRAPHCARHEDMTLLIRVINVTLADGSLTPTQGGRIYPVSVPYSNHQSTSKTSVTLSLVMPAQGTLTNGSNTASTLEGDTPTASESPTATLQSTNTHTQSSSSSSGDGSLFRQRGSQAAQPDETGRVPPYVDFTHFYRLWGSDHSEGHGLSADLGPHPPEFDVSLCAITDEEPHDAEVIRWLSHSVCVCVCVGGPEGGAAGLCAPEWIYTRTPETSAHHRPSVTEASSALRDTSDRSDANKSLAFTSTLTDRSAFIRNEHLEERQAMG